jgi:hypothetical protein
MKTEDPELIDVAPSPELAAAVPPTTGTVDDDDDLADERPDENEAPIRETSEATEAPEEFEVDDEDDLGHPEDDDADVVDDIEDDA